MCAHVRKGRFAAGLVMPSTGPCITQRAAAGRPASVIRTSTFRQASRRVFRTSPEVSPAGFGVEYAFLGNFTGRIEYRYADFGEFNYNPAPAFPGLTEHHRLTEHAVRAGLAFKFGGAPPPRQY